tara:strand:+ start:1403 stop:1819 length:417 start_codon:yes stop_codon:yes gene_type:complete
MSDLIKLITAYPVWVRISLVGLCLGVAILLIFFKNEPPSEAQTLKTKLDNLGITQLDLDILILITEPYELEARTTKWIAAKLNEHEINVKYSRSNLIKKGLILDAQQSSDGNTHEDLILINEKGRRFLAENGFLQKTS